MAATLLLMTASALAGSEHWEIDRRANSADTAGLIFVLRRNAAGLAALEEAFWAVSDPDSAEYGLHLSQHQITELVAAPAGRAERVLGWLHGAGVAAELNVHGDLVSARIAAPAAEALLNTTLQLFRHRDRREAPQILRASSPHVLPAGIREDVVAVVNLHEFPTGASWIHADHDPASAAVVADAHAGSGDWPSDCKGCTYYHTPTVTPAVLRQAYQLGSAPVGSANGSIAVAEFTKVFWDQADLSAYGTDCGLGNITIDHYNGSANKPKQCSIPVIIKPDLCKEAMLDIETIKGVVGTVPLTNFYTDDYSLMGWALALNDLPDGQLPLVHSVSYENDESQNPVTYMQATSIELQKLGARGASVLFASGDTGIDGRAGTPRKLAAGFPAASPWVTAVGGTDFATKSVIGEETGWWGSGGGFSDVFPTPDYQAAAVSHYRHTAPMPDPTKHSYNLTGAGFPDVAALAGNKNPYCITLAGKVNAAYGTSAATPMVASVVAKLNEQRLARGGAPLGFLNPWIYKNADAFHDITTGVNCGINTEGCDDGFHAIAGWDAVTGVGSPNYLELVKRL